LAMMKLQSLALVALALALAPETVFGQELDFNLNTRDIQKRDPDSFQKLNRMRNAHACIMSIVFIILYPLGAIFLRFPIDRTPFLKNTYLRNKVPAMHAPVQLLALVMMIGAMGLGIRLAHDLEFFNNPVHAHIVIGLLVCAVIILVQPAMGILQHMHFRKTGGKSWFGIIHRWTGRIAILLGIVNNGLGFQLAEDWGGVNVPMSSYYRNFIIAGVLALIWLGLAVYDEFRGSRTKTAVDGEGHTSMHAKHSVTNP